MGGQASKSAEYRSQLERHINQTFEQQCTTNGVCSQSLVLGNLNIDATGNCKITFENECKFDGDAQCNMTNALQSLAPQLKSQDPKLIDELGKMLDGKFDRTNIQSQTIESITNAFKQKCATNTGSYQSIKSGDISIRCSDQSTFRMRNKAAHSANCITNMVNQAIDNIDDELKGPGENSVAYDYNDDDETDPEPLTASENSEWIGKVMLGSVVLSILGVGGVILYKHRLKKNPV